MQEKGLVHITEFLFAYLGNVEKVEIGYWGELVMTLA
jgi:hypothetical protein